MKSEEIRKKLQKLLTNFEQELKSDGLRNKVLSLVPCFNHLRDFGKSLIPSTIAGRLSENRHFFSKQVSEVRDSAERAFSDSLLGTPREYRKEP